MTSALSGPPLDTPRRRRLRTFAFDPMSTRLSGRFLTVSVPYESDLQPGPRGDLVEVIDYDPARKKWYATVDLNDRFVLAQDGLKPAEADPRSHQQIIYAVTMSVIERFERYLGRRFRWRGMRKLGLVPHAFEGRNAYFDPTREAVLFGYYRADTKDPGANIPGQIIFTCLSSDIIAHEVTHAIVHRLRPHFSTATNPDVFAWHEAFADLIALFQHFEYRDVVFEAVTGSSGSIQNGTALFDLAAEFGQSTGRGAALRSAISREGQRTPQKLQEATEPHERGACFVGAVFDAYLDRFQFASADLLRIASAGTGVLPAGRLHPDLVARVTTEAVVTADRFLGMVVRAFDYLPPVDVTFGDVVRAIVTADHGLYPDDAGGLRATLVEALRRRGIYPDRVDSLTDSALVWPPGGSLTFVDGKPGVPLEELITQSTIDLATLGKREGFVSRRVYSALTEWGREHAVAIGLEPSLPIRLQSAHVTYRMADDRQPQPEIVVQYTQRRKDLEADYQPDLAEADRIHLLAGTTLIGGVDGQVKHIVAKPLPLVVGPKDSDDADYVHEFGLDRLNKMKTFFEQTEVDDPLAVWTDEPAVRRLDFASLHADDIDASR